MQELLTEHGNVKMLQGQRAVVRNGYLPARQVLTSVGDVAIQVPKVICGAEHSIRIFQSSIDNHSNASQRTIWRHPFPHRDGAERPSCCMSLPRLTNLFSHSMYRCTPSAYA